MSLVVPRLSGGINLRQFKKKTCPNPAHLQVFRLPVSTLYNYVHFLSKPFISRVPSQNHKYVENEPLILHPPNTQTGKKGSKHKLAPYAKKGTSHLYIIIKKGGTVAVLQPTRISCGSSARATVRVCVAVCLHFSSGNPHRVRKTRHNKPSLSLLCKGAARLHYRSIIKSVCGIGVRN